MIHFLLIFRHSFTYLHTEDSLLIILVSIAYLGCSCLHIILVMSMCLMSRTLLITSVQAVNLQDLILSPYLPGDYSNLKLQHVLLLPWWAQCIDEVSALPIPPYFPEYSIMSTEVPALPIPLVNNSLTYLKEHSHSFWNNKGKFLKQIINA